MRKKKATDVIIFFRDLIIVIIIIILPNKVVISLHPSYFSPIFVLQELFFQIINFGSVCHTIINNSERDRIYFCKVRWIMNFSNILLSCLKTEIFWTETPWNLYDKASSITNNLRSRERLHLSHLGLHW